MRKQILEIAEHHEQQAQRVFMELEGLNIWVKQENNNPSQENAKKFMKEYATRMIANHKKWAILLRKVAKIITNTSNLTGKPPAADVGLLD